MKYIVLLLVVLVSIHARSDSYTKYSEVKIYAISDWTTKPTEIHVLKGALQQADIDTARYGISSAVYEIEAVERGNIQANEVRLTFYASSLHDSLPNEAILIMTSTVTNENRTRVYYSALGDEAWRGILPYSDE